MAGEQQAMMEEQSCARGWVWPAALVLLSVLLPSTSLATTDGTTTRDIATLDLAELLETEIAVGTVGGSTVRDVPAVVETMDAETIRRLGARDLRELLLRLGGTYEQPLAPAPFLANTVRMRGGPVSSRILVLIDDHVLSSESYESYDAYSIPIDAIDRVEFLRGPAAVLYGSSAMAGVLRVVTKAGSQSGGAASVTCDPTGPGHDLTARAAYSRPLAGQTLQTRIDAQLRRSEPLRFHLPRNEAGLTTDHHMRADHVSALATVRYGGWYLRGHVHRLRSAMLGFTANPLGDAHDSTADSVGTEIAYSLDRTPWLVKASAALDTRSRQLDIGNFPPVGEYTRTRFDFRGISAHANMDLAYNGGTWSASMGLHLRPRRAHVLRFAFVDTGHTNPVGPPPGTATWSVEQHAFLQGDIELAPGLSLVAGGRITAFKPGFENEPALPTAETSAPFRFYPMGRLALVWHAHKPLTVKALYGRAIRLPCAEEMYGRLGGLLLPNPNLRPEIQDTLEMALDAQLTRVLTLRLNAFYNLMRDAIAVVGLDETSASGHHANVDRTLSTYGVEASAQWKPRVWLTMDAALTAHQGRYDNGDRLGSLPPVLASGRMHIEPLGVEKLSVTPAVRYCAGYQGKRGHAIVDLTVIYRISASVSASASLLNALDERVYTPYVIEKVDAFLRDSRALRLGLTAEL